MKGKTFILGAGFSKEFGDGPLMNNLWPCLEKKLNDAKNKGRKNPSTWAKSVEDFFISLESKVKELDCDRFKDQEFLTYLGENIEYIFTLLGLEVERPVKYISIDNASFEVPLLLFSLLQNESLSGAKHRLTELTTFLYRAFVNLEPNKRTEEFCGLISENDVIINFNYDLLIEKYLWNIGVWSPLGGYMGVEKFKREEDEDSLTRADRKSKVKIHKMHGSLDWTQSHPGIGEIKIIPDNWDEGGFFFNGIDSILNRKSDFESNDTYQGKYFPPWLLPSYIKPFKSHQFLEIWKSAMIAVHNSDEVVIFGYSFRPEDPNSLLLLSMISEEGRIILIDPVCDAIAERLDESGIRVSKIFKTYSDYLDASH